MGCLSIWTAPKSAEIKNKINEIVFHSKKLYCLWIFTLFIMYCCIGQRIVKIFLKSKSKKFYAVPRPEISCSWKKITFKDIRINFVFNTLRVLKETTRNNNYDTNRIDENYKVSIHIIKIKTYVVHNTTMYAIRNK